MADQPLLPGMPLPVGGITLKPPSDVDTIVELFSALRGPLVHWNRARGQAKQMLAAGYTVGEVTGCIRWLAADPQYSDWDWTLVFVGTKLPAYRREQGASPISTLASVVPPEGWTR